MKIDDSIVPENVEIDHKPPELSFITSSPKPVHTSKLLLLYLFVDFLITN